MNWAVQTWCLELITRLLDEGVRPMPLVALGTLDQGVGEVLYVTSRLPHLSSVREHQRVRQGVC